MPTKKSAWKHLRSDRPRRLRNQRVTSELKTRRRKFDASLGEHQLDHARTALRELLVKLDKAASKGILHKRKAARTKSRLTKRLQHASAAKPTDQPA